MARYIDAGQKITITYYDEENEEWSKKSKTIDEFLCENADEEIPTADVVDKERYDRLLENSIIISEALNRYQTADVVKVVRCADCKYLNEDLAVGGWDGSCRYWNTHSVTYSWFCSQGERKDEEEPETTEEDWYKDEWRDEGDERRNDG